jgi:hypothetical protein
MSHEGGPESTQQRTVAELLAMYGGESGEQAPRRRRRRSDDVSDTGAHKIIDRVNSESNKLSPIRDDQPPPTRTSHRQQRHAPPPPQQPPVEPRQQPRAAVPPPTRQAPPPAARQHPPSLPKLPAITHVEPTSPVQPPRRVRRAAPPPVPPPQQPSGQFARPPAADPTSGSFPRPPASDPNSGPLARPPAADRNSGPMARPPAADRNSGSFVRPPEPNSGSFVRPPVPDPNATADTFIRPPSPDLGPFARPPAQGSGYFAAPAPPKQPPREDVTEQMPRVGPAPVGTRTGQHPVQPAGFGPQTQVTNGFGPDRYADEVDLDDGVRYPEEDDDFGRDDFDDEDAPASPGREWLVMVGQVALSVLGGAAVWLGFNWLWGRLPQAALVAALAVIVGLVWIVRKIRRADDLQTTGLAVLVGLFVTVSPAALLLLSK